MTRTAILEMVEDTRVKSDAQVELEAAHAAWFAGVMRREAGKSGVVLPWIAQRFERDYKDGYAGKEFSRSSEWVCHRGSGRSFNR